MTGRATMALIAVVCAPLWAGCGETSSPATPTAVASPETAAFEPLPRIDMAGIRELVATESAAGRVVVIDFWATWCVPCVEMFPHLHDGLKALGDRLVGVSISFDSETDGYEERAIAFLTEQHALKNAYLAPDPQVQEDIVDGIGVEWDQVAPPAVYVFGLDGKLAAEFVGAPDPAETAQEIVAAANALLATPPSTSEIDSDSNGGERG